MTWAELRILAKAIADPATSDAERDLILSVFAGIYIDAVEEVVGRRSENEEGAAHCPINSCGRLH
jgi:hypothetical protein